MKHSRFIRVLKQSVPTTFRLFLGIVFLIYGLVKLYPGQFGVPGPDAVTTNGEGFVMVWTFFGYSRIYEIMIGLGEIISALLIMIPRTATLGAICYFPIVINVTMVNYVFEIGVQDLSTVMTIMCMILLWLDRDRLLLLLEKREKEETSL